MNILKLTPKQIIDKIFIIYILFFILFLVVSFDTFPPAHLAFIQLLMWGIGYVIAQWMMKQPRLKVFPIFCFQSISIFLLTIINISAYNDPLGYDPHDALAYREFGELYGDKPYEIFFANLVLTLRSFDDWGFPSLVWALYHFWGSYAWIALLVLNVVVITYGSAILYELSLYFFDEKFARLTSVLWGLMPFAVCTATGGLKENFFAFIAISAFYYLYRCLYDRGGKNVALLLFFVLLSFFLRIATGLCMLLCLFVALFLKLKFIKKNIKKIAISCIVISALLLPIVFNRLSEYRGVTYESVTASADKKAESAGGAAAFLMNAVSGFVGPFPNFVSKDEDKINYITRYSFTALLKMIISFFFIYIVFIIFRPNNLFVIPLYLFVLLDILMIIFTFFALNMRFHWPHMPLFFLLSVWGYRNINKNSLFYHLYSPYLLLSTLIILLYNLR